MRRRAFTLLVLLLSLVAATGASGSAAAGPPDGAVGIRLVPPAAGRTDDPRAQLYIVDHLRPGQIITRQVELANGTTTATRLQLYAAGADVGGGQFRFADGRSQDELAGWTTVQPAELLVPARATASAAVTIRVPRDAAAGERYAVVWAELPRSVARGGGVTAVNRVGVRVYLSVGPGGAPRADFVIQSLAADRRVDGRPEVVVTVRNRGARAVDLGGALRLTDGPGGLRAGPFAARLGTTLGVGDAGRVLVPLDAAVPAGPWHATVTLRSGTVVRTATARITFPTSPGAASPPVAAASATPFSARQGATGVGAGLALLGGGAFLLLRRRRGQPIHQRPASHRRPRPSR
jgi:hypothetical protein